jgi:diaminohydroxyphosphoribosylaminopyrimidine deaminase/5-amino-6-(5-phosphoribosylamino)uracil reductase
VICNIDPNKNVNGKGISILRDAGIEVVTGILEVEGKELNKFYFKYVQQGLPYITLKIAQSLDGKISASKNQQTWLTGKKSVKMVHRMRTEYDAVLVGAGTIKTDNPLLTVREVKGRNPSRVIVDGNLNVSPDSKIFKVRDPMKTFIFYSDSASKKRVQQFEKIGTMMFNINKSNNGKVDLKVVLKTLANNRITSVLVEGGRDIFTQFLEQGLYDEIIIFQTPKILGSGISAFNQKKLKKLKLIEVEKLDADVKLVYRKN